MTEPGRLNPDGPDMTVDELAQHLRISPRTIRRWAEAGDFPGAVRFHRKWRFPQATVIDYKQRHAAP